MILIVPGKRPSRSGMFILASNLHEIDVIETRNEEKSRLFLRGESVLFF